MCRVSVIIPCYNNSNTILETLKSIKNQTYKNLEIIVVDDGSTDNTKVLLENQTSYKNLSYFYKTNEGPSFTRNFGVHKAIGEYIFFIDADDLINEKYIEKCVAILDNNQKIEIVYARASYFEAKKGEWKLNAFNITDFLRQNCIHISCLIRKKTFDKLGGFDTKLKILEDWDLWIRIIDNKPKAVFRIDEILFYYRKRKEKSSLTNTLHKKDIFETSYLYVYNKNYKYYELNKLGILNLLNSEKINSKYKRKYFKIWYIKLFYRLKNGK